MRDYAVSTGLILLGGLAGCDSYAEYSDPDGPYFARTLDVYCCHQDNGQVVCYQVDVTWVKEEPWFSQEGSHWGFLGVVDESLTSIS